MELNLKILAPLLQCTSIDRCALFMRAKKYIYYFIEFLSPLLLNFFFLFLSFSFSLSDFSSFFLFLPLPVLHFNQSVASLYSVLTLRCADWSPGQPSADHSLRSPPQRPNLRAPPSLCYLMPSANVGLCLCFPTCWRFGFFFFFFFFFFFCCGLVVVVVVVLVVVLAVADGRCGCGWCCDVFFG